jgi:hypothetical protein
VQAELGGTVGDLGVLEPRLRAMLADASANVQSLSGYLLAWHLIRGGRQGDALALLAGPSGAVAGGALAALRENLLRVELQQVLPALRCCLHRPEAEVQSEADILLYLLVLSQEARWRPALAALADWSEQGDALRFATRLVAVLMRRLRDKDEAVRRDALRTLSVAADRGLEVAPTLSELSSALATASWPGEGIPGLAERLTRHEGSVEPLVLWLTLLARPQPAEAVAGLEELARLGTDLSSAGETLRRLGVDAADPGVRHRAQALLASKS